ncbi:protein-disulfide reductase DsbD domain-containing protein [Rhizobium sp. SGZ-381]|uniref:protein-disulfide reductase DsbD domain-containing protein n=1 Tax=Rhizobium sp. SGZ-381 TaxID=3342800 RepID=UPI00366BEE80
MPRHAYVAFLICSALLWAQGASAAMSAWAENEGGRMRIIALPAEPDGTVRGALQIEPKNGWITYWKEPGQAGIPPQITISPGDGIRLQKVEFPVPRQFMTGDVRDLGYDHAVTLPFTLAVEDKAKPLMLNASAFVGLCRNICIPFQADFHMDMASAKGLPFEENLILDEARKSLPEQPSEDFAVAHHALTDGKRNLRVGLRLPADSPPPQIFVATPAGHVLFDQTGAQMVDGTYVVTMPLGKGADKAVVAGRNWDILVIAGSRAMETALAFD